PRLIYYETKRSLLREETEKGISQKPSPQPPIPPPLPFLPLPPPPPPATSSQPLRLSPPPATSPQPPPPPTPSPTADSTTPFLLPLASPHHRRPPLPLAPDRPAGQA
uniref:Uncharacterized protein n=1 Tax=Aegilops tauschii subsp. strangulata TaxID=200361 RepID=A0A453K6L2_AEGTS